MAKLVKNKGSVLNIHGAAEYLNVSKSYIYTLIHNGEIPYIKFGRNYRVLKEDLDDYCRNQRISSSSPNLAKARNLM